MSLRRIFFFSLVAIALLLATGIPIKSNPGPDDELVAGRNVNMVSGTLLPLGDPFLQRQNEPSIAVSSRNPMHLFAAANDYRTIDMPHPYEVRGIPGVAAGRDAWIGVFESFDGGESWISMLLPGFPQDSSIEGSASPIYGFDTACDPKVCAGAEGLFYLSGIAFMRNQLAGVVFVARYVDNNNRENVEEVIDENTGERKYVGPIEYMDTRIAGIGNPGQFIDMPNMAVDVPRGDAPFGNVYLTYTVFLGNTGLNIRSRIVFVTSTDGGMNWSKSIKLTESQHIIQRPVIAIDPSDPTGNTIYVVFRRFAHRETPGGIVFVKSIDGGRSFTKPADVATLLYPFDQWTKGPGITSPRTNSYPTMAIGGDGVPYVAWAQRYGQDGLPNPDGQARIVFSYSQNGGLTWSAPPQLVDPNYEGNHLAGGHQFMPSITSAGGNKTVIWYDQRDDIALHDPNILHDPYEKFIEDVWDDHRHTIDVRAAEAPFGSVDFGTSILLSRHLFFMHFDETGAPIKDPETGEILLWQGQHNYSGFPLFHLGTKPFLGDYIQITPSPQILPPSAPSSNSWVFNTDPSEPTRSHGVWTDTRDVWPPAGDLWGDWITYTPPNSVQDTGFEQQNPCNPDIDTTGMRNQNIYTADLNHGVIVGSPGNTKQLDIQRSFVVFVKDTMGFNDTNAVENRSFHLSLDEVGQINASFAQIGDVDSLDIIVPPYSSVSCTVYVDENLSNQFAPVIVNVYEGEGGPLVGRVYLNPDSTNNPLLGPDGELLLNESHKPKMSNPKIWKYNVGNQDDPNASFLSPRAQNPRAQNSGYINPRAQNPRAQNPRAQNPRAQNPRAQNENIVNNEMYNPRAQNPRAQNAALTDMTWTVTNDGNTTSVYSFNIASDLADDINAAFDADYEQSLIAQVLVYKTHMVPIDNKCELFQTHADELIVNFANPRAQNPRAQNTTLGMSSTEQNGSVEPITFYLAPWEEAEVILRVYDPNTEEGNSFDDYINIIGGETEAEAADTGQTEPEWVAQPDAPWGPEASYLPEIGTDSTSLSFATVLEVNPDVQIPTIYNTGEGTLNYTISDDADWLSVWPPEGAAEEPDDGYDEQNHTVSVDVSVLAVGTYQGTITITDPYATNNPLRVPVTLTIAGEARYLKVTGNSTVMAGNPKELTITAYDEYDNVALGYAGLKDLIFSGPGIAPGGTEPTVAAIVVGTATPINFTDGISDTGAATLLAYKAETISVDVTDGTINSFEDDTYDYDLTVTPAPLNYVKIQHWGGGPGGEIGDNLMVAGEDLNCYAVGYDAYGNYREDVGVTWSTTGDLDPIDSGPSQSVVFTPTSAPTSGTIEAHHATATDDATDTTTVVVGPTAKLAFSIQPGSATAGEVFTQQPVVEVQDQYGNTIISDDTTQVSIAILNDPSSSATLSGNTTTTVTDGVATFSNLSIDKAGSGYTLIATSSPIYTQAISEPFNVLAKITGTVMYNGESITPNHTTTTDLDFWIYKGGQYYPISAQYDNTTGIYTIPNIEPGTYKLNLYIDAATPTDGERFPGDFAGSEDSIQVPVDQPEVVRDIDCIKYIHITDPINNLISQGAYPPNPYDTYSSPVVFQWDAISEATRYDINVQKYQHSPNHAYIETVLNTSTSNTQISIDLPAIPSNQHYELWMTAHNNTYWVGETTIVYDAAYGTDYRFRIIPGAASYLKITGSSTMTAGSSQTITITAYDQNNNVATNYTGDKVLTFSGASASPNPATEPICSDSGAVYRNFGVVTTIDFSTGVGSSTMKLYNAETAHIKAIQGGIGTSNANDLDVTVTPTGKAKLQWDTSPPTPVYEGATWNAFGVEIADPYGNRTNDGDQITLLPASLGGTRIKNATNGLATFDDIFYGASGTISVQGSSGSLSFTAAVNVEAIRVLDDVPNRSFENGTGTWPDGWEPVESATYLWDVDYVYEGLKSVGITCGSACDSVVRWITTDFISIDNSKDYQLSVKFYWPGNPQTGGDYSGLGILFYDANGNELTSLHKIRHFVSTMGDWQEISIRFEDPLHTWYLDVKDRVFMAKIFLSKYTMDPPSAATVWFDYVELSPIIP